MAHLKKSASTGRLLKTATGHLSKGCGGATCSNCAGTILTTARLTVSGVTNNGGACYYPGMPHPTSYDLVDINGTYDLTLQVSPDCFFALTTGTGINLYTSVACPGTPTSTVNVYLTLQIGGSNMIANVTVGGGIGPPTFITAEYNSTSAPYDCDGGTTYTLSRISSSGSPTLATGGSIDVDFV